MKHFRLRKGFFCIAAAASLLYAGGAIAQEKLDAKAQICDDFDKTVIMGGKVDEAGKYLTDDFKEHNARLTADGLTDFVTKLKAMRTAMAARGGGQVFASRPPGSAQPERTVLSRGDLIVFITAMPPRDNPNSPGQTLPASSHFDVYMLRNGKIAEHWD
jgi:predicted SnoaL-like aldol condensation-catalyzing enzyme